jgi:hypothetical protein
MAGSLIWASAIVRLWAQSSLEGSDIVDLKNAVGVVVADKLKLGVAVSALALMIAAGVTFGSWSVSGAGNGYAKAVTPSNLTLNDASASTVAQLYPGGTGDVKVSITNPNAFAVTISGVSGSGTITSDKGATCDASTGVSYTNQTGLSLALGAGATQVFTLTGTAAMSNATVDACKGAIFTIPVSVTATS